MQTKPCFTSRTSLKLQPVDIAVGWGAGGGRGGGDLKEYFPKVNRYLLCLKHTFGIYVGPDYFGENFILSQNQFEHFISCKHMIMKYLIPSLDFSSCTVCVVMISVFTISTSYYLSWTLHIVNVYTCTYKPTYSITPLINLYGKSCLAGCNERPSYIRGTFICIR